MSKQTPEVVHSDGYAWALEFVASAEANLAIAKAALRKEQVAAKIRCCRCGAAHPINTQIYIQTYWYTSPRGCMDGDYWSSGEANWKCPDCGFKNRFDAVKDKYATMPNEFYRPELVGLKGMFGRVAECHCDYRHTCQECKKSAVAQ